MHGFYGKLEVAKIYISTHNVCAHNYTKIYKTTKVVIIINIE